MKILSLNCGTFRPGLLSPPMNDLVTHVLLIEMERNLVLIDSGVGARQMQDLQRTWKGRIQRLLMGLEPDPGATAAAQLKRSGYSPRDVTDVILTHLDTDHVGGLCDFPQARAHLFRPELERANQPRTRFERLRFQKHLWSGHRLFELYDEKTGDGKRERFHDFELTPLRGLPDEISFIALPGHTMGHGGVYLRNRDFVFAGDACVNSVVLSDRPQPGSVRLYQTTTSTDPGAWKSSVNGLKKLCSCGITVCCAHDRAQFESLRSTWNR